MTTGKRLGIGGSLNRVLSIVNNPWMYTTDDWFLTEKLDLTNPLKLLSRGYDFVRLGPVHPNLLCETKFDGYWWLDVSTVTGFAFATRPFLATKEFYDRIGPFKEHVNAYDTERDYSDRVTAKKAKVAYSDVSLSGPWEHIGDYEVGTLYP